MNKRTVILILVAAIFLSLALLDCSGDEKQPADDDSQSDDDAATDDDSQNADDDVFEKDGVLIIRDTTDAQGYVNFSVAGQGEVGFYVRDEAQVSAPLAGVSVFLITKNGTAVVMVLDQAGEYLPFISEVGVLESTEALNILDDSVFGRDWLLGLAGQFAASSNEPMVISAQIPADLLKVLLFYFFESYGTEALPSLSAVISNLAGGATTAKVVQFALLADPDTATGIVPVTLAVSDRSDPGLSDFLPNLYASRCYADTATFDLYLSREPLSNQAPADYLFILAAPNQNPEPAETADLSVLVLDAVSAAPLAGARVALSPLGEVGHTDATGHILFTDVPFCLSQNLTLLYLRISLFGYYPAQFKISQLNADQTNVLTVTLSPITAGAETPTWLSIPAGGMSMGCSPGDVWCDADEYPPHTVQISAFLMTETEITQQQYREVTGNNPAWYNDCPNCPVEFVTWAEALAFCQNIGGSLPTEAQWEYAARAGAVTRYYCGDDPTCLEQISWDINNAGSRTHPVKQKQANAFGLYDMAGNVWEFTGDYYAADYYQQSPALDPPGPLSGAYRVMRGGSWYSTNENLRVSNRFEGDQVNRYCNFGFRCVK